MDVILLERVGRLGQMGDVVRVKDGFARNFLLPQGKALRATEANKKNFEGRRIQLEARNLELKNEAEAVGATLEGQIFTVIRSASEAGVLYGSVTGRDIAEAATAAGFSVERRQIALDKPVKEIGIHDIRVSLHPEVDCTVRLNVARSLEEASVQASGKTIAELRAEEEAAQDLDVAALFEDVGKFDEGETDGGGGRDRDRDRDRDRPRDRDRG